MATVDTYGKLLIVGKDGKSELEFPLDKSSILIGRQVHSIRIKTALTAFSNTLDPFTTLRLIFMIILDAEIMRAISVLSTRKFLANMLNSIPKATAV
jgi:hypothetical protein